jgi:hypothetical protein
MTYINIRYRDVFLAITLIALAFLVYAFIYNESAVHQITGYTDCSGNQIHNTKNLPPPPPPGAPPPPGVFPGGCIGEPEYGHSDLLHKAEAAFGAVIVMDTVALFSFNLAPSDQPKKTKT